MRSKVWIKAICMLVILLTTALLLAKRGQNEVIAPHELLSGFPTELGSEWRGNAVAIDPWVIEALGAGDFADRFYRDNLGGPPVELFIGYFPTQRTGVSIHSPKNCLPGSGWAPIDSKYATLTVRGLRQYQVNEYVIQKDDQKRLVLYWYQAHGRLIASEYAAKFHLVADSIRLNRSDAALVRIITPITGDEGIQQAEQRALRFARVLIPSLEHYIPV